jgi:UDP-N-acetylglucosamine 2-epimerase (non-hydrolysing)
MKICIVVGTRPEVIKMAPVIRECQKRNLDFFIIHSNQHYSSSMDEIFFQELELPAPKYNLNVGSGKHSNQMGNILIKIEPIIEKEKPDILLAQGDTNTVVAAALAASKLEIKVGHIEAGLRSYDRSMPEETNRIVTDHISDYLFAVTSNQVKILSGEGVNSSKIVLTGNTIVDALFQALDISAKKSSILDTLNITSKDYFLATIHRSSNVDSEIKLKEVLSLLDGMAKKFNKKIIWPVHPRTLKQIETFKLELSPNIKTVEPVGYFDFIQLEKHASLILTDSGGVQEEACILGVPCLTIRENTERPETVEVGANALIGTNLEKGIVEAENFLTKNKSWKNPFGDGHSSQIILDTVLGIKKLDTTIYKPKKVSVIGLGYMGLPMASLIANAGHSVVGVDLKQDKVDLINKGLCPFEEHGLPDLVKTAVLENNFKAQLKPVASDIYIISVPTPSINQKCDLSYVIKACESLLDVISDGELVIIESTIKPRTCDDIISPLFKNAGKNILVGHCPERAIPGNTIFELINNDRIIGGTTNNATEIIYDFYSSFIKGKLHKTNARTAECCKLVENSFRDVNIAFANELAELSDDFDVNVWQLIGLANKHPRVNILNPGPGVGGHCIAVDPWFLTEDTDKAKLIPAARMINDARPSSVAHKMDSALNGKKSKIGILGVSYKKNVDDSRETPAEKIVEELLHLGHEVIVHDPFVSDWILTENNKNFESFSKWADAFILVTDHDIFKDMKFEKPILDTRNLYDGKDYSRIFL